MGNIGGGEVLVILLVALIVLGPERLPGVARQVGKVLGEVKRVSSGFQAEVRSAMDDLSIDTTPPPSGAKLPPAPVASPSVAGSTSGPAAGEPATTAQTGGAEPEGGGEPDPAAGSVVQAGGAAADAPDGAGAGASVTESDDAVPDPDDAGALAGGLGERDASEGGADRPA